MSQKLRRLTAAGSVLVATAVALPAMATAVAPTTVAPTTAGQRSGPLPYLDVRDATTATSAAPARTLPAADRAARDKLVRGLGRQAALETDPVTAPPRTFGRLDRALTSARAGDPAAIALDYVRANASALGLSDADFATLRLADRTTIDGITTLRWRQEVRGVPAFDNELRVNVDGDGRVINVLGAPRHALSVASTTPRLSAADALVTLARDVGSAPPPPAAGSPPRPAVTPGPTGPRDETTFASGDRARLVLFGDVTAVRL